MSSPVSTDPNPLPTAPRYEILGVVAQSGMSTIYRVRDLNMRRDFALKVLQPWVKHERLLFESQVTARLDHPAIMPVFSVEQFSDGRLCLVMPLISGRTLADILRDHGARSDLPRLLHAFEQVCRALDYAHAEGVIHRNLKPSKVLLDPDRGVLLIGWGLARVTRDHGTFVDPGLQGLIGTAAFMPPEQARSEVADERSDVFGLGGLLCAILTGEPPFAGKDVRDLLQRAAAGDVAEAFSRLDACGADPELIALAKRCLASNPADRPASAAEVAEIVAARRPPFEPQPEAVPTPPQDEAPIVIPSKPFQAAEPPPLLREHVRFFQFVLVVVFLLLSLAILLVLQL